MHIIKVLSVGFVGVNPRLPNRSPAVLVLAARGDDAPPVQLPSRAGVDGVVDPLVRDAPTLRSPRITWVCEAG